jgi:hypothetical protein
MTTGKLLLVLTCAVFALVLLIGANTMRDAGACEQKAAQVGAPFAFGYLSGCNLFMDGRWVDGDRVVVSNGMVYVKYEGVPV